MHLDLMRDSAKMFPTMADPEAFTSLRVWHCKYRSLQPVLHLRNLRKLKIAALPDDDLTFLQPLRSLEWLSILHLPRIRSLQPLASLTTLQSLELRSLPNWDDTSRITTVDSLAPLTHLPRLRHLTLIGVAAPDESLAVLAQCRALSSVTLQGFAGEEVRHLLKERNLEVAPMPEEQDH